MPDKRGGLRTVTRLPVTPSAAALAGAQAGDSGGRGGVGGQGGRPPATRITRSKRPGRVLLSDDSHEEWRPPHALVAEPPYWAYDVLYGAAAGALTWWWARTPSTVVPPAGSASPATGWATAAAMESGSSWHTVATAAWSCVTPAVWLAVLVAVVVVRFFRGLEPVSYSRMLESERVLLDTVQGDVRHHWNKFTTQHATWHIHSLVMRGARREGGNASPAPSPAPAPAPVMGEGAPSACTDDRPAVVLLHGHSAGAAHWEAVIDRIAEMGDFYVLDLPGWGRSPIPAALADAASTSKIVELQAEMLAGWLAVNRLKRIVLLGHSYGGFQAVQFALRHPSIVDQLILVAPAGLTPVMPAGSLLWGGMYRFTPPQYIARVTGRLGLYVFKTLYLAFTVEDRRFPDFYYQLAAQTASTGCGDTVAGRFLRFDWRGGLWWSYPCLTDVMALDMPVSVIWGQRDDLLPAIFGPLLHRIRPRTDLYIIKDALHNPAHNNARAFCDALGDCLLKYRGQPRVTLAGCADGTLRCPDGTGDDLLEPTSAVSRGYVPPPPTSLMAGVGMPRSPVLPSAGHGAFMSHHLTLPPIIDLGRQVSSGHHRVPLGSGTVAGLHGTNGATRDLGRLSPADAVVAATDVSACGQGTGQVTQAPHPACVTTFRADGAGSMFTFDASGGVRRRGVEGSVTPPGMVDTAGGVHWGCTSTMTTSPHGGGGSDGDATSTSCRTAMTPTASSTPSSTSSRRSGGSSYLHPPALPPMPSPSIISSILGSSAFTTHTPTQHTAPAPTSTAAHGGDGVAVDPWQSSLAPSVSMGVPLAREVSAPWRGRDGVVSEYGKGRGYCNACYRAVHLHKSYWRCSCAAWSFNAHLNHVTTLQHFGAMLAFLDELYVTGTFNARTSDTIVMYLSVRTPLPSPITIIAPADQPAAPPRRPVQVIAGAYMPAVRTMSAGKDGGDGSGDAAAPSPTHTPRLAHRTGEHSNGVVFPPAPARFPRGEVFLLE